MKFVNLLKYGFVIEPRYYFYGWAKTEVVMARKSIAEALVAAKKLLPEGYNFKIWDGKRSRTTHAKMIVSFQRRLRNTYPRASDEEINTLTKKFGGPLIVTDIITRLDTHTNGGALDLTIVDRLDNELYMGTDHDDLTDRAATDYYDTHINLVLDKEASENRKLLKQVMTAVGFKNYTAEWWHWSLDI